MQQQNFWPTTKFPWLTNDEISRLEQLTSNLSWYDKLRRQQELYRETLDYKNKQNYMEDRSAANNELYYRSTQTKDQKTRNTMQNSVRQEELADLVRAKYNLPYDKPTEEIIQWVIKQAQDKWVSSELFYDYLNKGKKDFLYEMGFETESFWDKLLQTAENVVWGVYDSVTWLPRMLVKWTADAIWWTAKQLWADENKVNSLVQSYKDSLQDFSWEDIGADTDSLTYQWAKLIWDTIQVATASWLWRAAIKAWWNPVLNILNRAWWGIDQLTSKAPVIWNMIKEGAQWAADMVLFNAINWEWTSLTEAWIWAWLGAAFPVVWKFLWWAKNLASKLIGKTAAKAELTWLINPAKLETVRSQLIQEWVAPWKWTAEDVWKWMLERWFKWDKDTIIKQLEAHATKSKDMVDELLNLSTSTQKLPEANEALQMLYEEYSKTPWMYQKAEEIFPLLQKEEFTLQELNQAKRYMDEAFNMYKMNWWETAWIKAEWLRNLRRSIKNTIENTAEKEWLGNVKLLNNETQIARWLLDWIRKKENAATIREFLSPFSTSRNWAILWWLWWSSQWDSIPEKIKNMAVWAVIWWIVWSTKAKTLFANAIKWLWGIEKKELTEYLATRWESLLSDSSKVSLMKILWENKALQEELLSMEWKNLERRNLIKWATEEVVDNTPTNPTNPTNTATENIVEDSSKVNDVVWNWTNEWQYTKVSSKSSDNIPNFSSEYTSDELKDAFNWKASEKESVDDIVWKFSNLVKEYDKKWENFSLKNLLNNIWKYKEAKVEYDEFLKQMAEDVWWNPLMPPLKILKWDWSWNWNWIARALEKAFWKSDWIDGVTDIVRGTVAVKDEEWMKRVIEWMKKKWIDYDDKFTNPTNLWYKDLSFIYKTKNWIEAEVQINTPEMLAAKEWKEIINMWITDEAWYKKILEAAWVEDTEEVAKWLWHKFYEEWRALDKWIDNWTIKWETAIQEAKKRMEEIEKESQEFYKKFEI